MLNLFEILLIVGLFILTGIIIYLWFHAIVYFLRPKKRTPSDEFPRTRFVFVIPAHDEETGIGLTVKNLLSVDYPREMFDVIVIADNCTDRTTEVAEQSGAECLIRVDPKLRGKGYALRYAFSELLPRGYDAVIVVDADSIVSPDILRAVDSRLSRGERVVQVHYGIANQDASILTYLFQVGNVIEDKFFWTPKETLNLPIILRGNGMCFTNDILRSYPWNAFSITEDTEYGIMLVEQGVRIHFADETGVYAFQPETLQQAFSQRLRWAAGNTTLTKRRAPRMILEGIRKRNLGIVDLGLSLIAGSKPLILIANLVLLSASVMCHSIPLLIWSSVLALAQGSYISLAILINGLTMQRTLRLVASPFYVMWLCIVSLLGLTGYRKNQWVRTSRT